MKFLAAAAAVLASASAEPVRGIPRSMDLAYSGPTFKCLDGSKEMPLSNINDGYCDCEADGSDEPGTSACANGRFYCVNKGYRGKYLPSAYVNDGVCDCCDGSDENDGNRICSNTCLADGAEWRKVQADSIQKAEEGARLRSDYAAQGTLALAEMRAKKATLDATLKTAVAARESAEAASKAAEEEEKKFKRAAKAAAAAPTSAGLAAAFVGLGLPGPSATNIVNFVAEAETRFDFENKIKVAAGFEIGAQVKPSEDAPGDHGVPHHDDGEQDLNVAGSGATVFLPSGWPVQGIETLWSDVHSAGAQELDSAVDARNRLSDAKAEESRIQSELQSLKDSEDVDFGSDNAFFALKGKCLEMRINNQYTYKVCPFGTSYQDSTSLGTFEGWGKKEDGSVDYSTMKFDNGVYCWNGPNRSIKVSLECGSVDALLKVDEPEKCTYTAVLQTPAACDAKHARELRLELEDEAGEAYDFKTEL